MLFNFISSFLLASYHCYTSNLENKHLCALLITTKYLWLFFFAVHYFTNNFDIYIFLGRDYMIHITCSHSIHLFLVFYSIGFLGNFVFHLLYRAILILEEIKHVKSRYKNSYMTLFKDAFTFPKSANAAFVIILFGICVKGTNGIFPLTVNGNLLFCYAPTIFLLGKVFELVGLTLQNI